MMLQLRHYEVNMHASICCVATYIVVFITLSTAVDTSKTELFIKECIITKRFKHPNVLTLIGVSYMKEEAVPLMILPFMHNGDVKSFIKSKRGNILEITEYPKVYRLAAAARGSIPTRETQMDHCLLIDLPLDLFWESISYSYWPILINTGTENY